MVALLGIAQEMGILLNPTGSLQGELADLLIMHTVSMAD